MTDDGVDAETSLSLSASLSLFSALTLFSHAHLWSLKLSLKMRVSSNELFSTLMKVKQAEPGCLRAFFGPSTLFLNRYVGATIIPWNLSYLQELKQMACYSL